VGDAGTIDLLAYTDKENEVPLDWEESDPRYIANAADIKLRAFSTKVGGQRVGTGGAEGWIMEPAGKFDGGSRAGAAGRGLFGNGQGGRTGSSCRSKHVAAAAASRQQPVVCVAACVPTYCTLPFHT
jgi:hypothetical protein